MRPLHEKNYAQEIHKHWNRQKPIKNCCNLHGYLRALCPVPSHFHLRHRFECECHPLRWPSVATTVGPRRRGDLAKQVPNGSGSYTIHTHSQSGLEISCLQLYPVRWHQSWGSPEPTVVDKTDNVNIWVELVLFKLGGVASMDIGARASTLLLAVLYKGKHARICWYACAMLCLDRPMWRCEGLSVSLGTSWRR